MVHLDQYENIGFVYLIAKCQCSKNYIDGVGPTMDGAVRDLMTHVRKRIGTRPEKWQIRPAVRRRFTSVRACAQQRS